jgi:membrane fusion protein, macrolide-specific efflux system
MKKKYVWMVITLVIIGGSYYEYKKTHPAVTGVQYKTAAAQVGTIATSVLASGNVVVDQSVNIDPTITGTVADLAVNVGDKVAKGQFLFSIVNDQLGVSVARSSASYESALSSLESAEASEKQAKKDYEDDDSKINKEKLEAAKAAVTAAEKNITAAGSDLNYQYSQAGKRKVTASIAGTVNAVNIKNGDDLSKLSSGSSRQVPMIIGNLTTMKAQVQVNEVDISNVSVGQKAMLTFNAIDGLSVSGKVEKMDSLGTLTSGVVTYNVTIDFDSLDPRIKPEMSVSAAIITGIKQDVLIVPNSAVKSQNGANYVQILDNGQATPVQKTVEVGISNNTNTEIISGLNVGDNVVTQIINSSTTTSTTSTTRTNSGGLGLPGLGGGRPD